MDEWLEEGFARRWDATAQKGNPTRTEQLDVLLALLQDEFRPGKAILDLGSGSGLVEEAIFERIPGARIVGVDGSTAMLSLAHERLASLRSHEDRFLAVQRDLTVLDTVDLPDEEYGIAISVQTLHNLPVWTQERVAAFVGDTLVEGGLFLNLDRIWVDAPSLYGCYQSVWRRLERLHDDRVDAAATFEGYLQEWSAKGEYPTTLEENLSRLRHAGFEAACLHLHGDRALFAARKKALNG